MVSIKASIGVGDGVHRRIYYFISSVLSAFLWEGFSFFVLLHHLAAQGESVLEQALYGSIFSQGPFTSIRKLPQCSCVELQLVT